MSGDVATGIGVREGVLAARWTRSCSGVELGNWHVREFSGKNGIGSRDLGSRVIVGATQI